VRRLDRVDEAEGRVAALDAHQLATAAQQRGGVAAPLRRAALAPDQDLQRLQTARQLLAQLGGGRGGDGVAAVLRPRVLVHQHQEHEQGLRHRQQRDQQAPEQHAAPAPSRGGRRRGGGDGAHRADQYCVPPAQTRYAVSRINRAGTGPGSPVP
jgi:hypothetical protein